MTVLVTGCAGFIGSHTVRALDDRSQWRVEQLRADCGAAYGQPSVILRSFHAAGADPAGDLAEDHDPETHLIPLVPKAIRGDLPTMLSYAWAWHPRSDVN